MQFRNTLVLGLMAVVLLSGCSWFSGDDDVVKVSPLPQVANKISPKKVWDVSVGNGIGDYYSQLRPAVDGSKVYAADRKGKVVALEASSGKSVWSVDLSEKLGLLSANKSAQLSGGLTVSGNQLYVGSEHADVYALSISNGAEVWKTRVASEALVRPVVSDGLVLVRTGNGMLQALDEKSGAIKWTVNLDMPNLSLRGGSAPAIAFGAAVIGGNNGRVSAILLQEGQLIWQQHIATPKGGTEIDRLSDINATPVIEENQVYAIGYNGNLVAMDLRSGQIIWRRDLGAMNDFIIDGKKLYLVDQNNNILALNRDGGAQLWQQNQLLHRGLTAPVLYKDYLVVADAEGYLHWLKAEDGQFVAQQKVDSSGFLSGPLVVDGKLIIQARSGKVYAYSL